MIARKVLSELRMKLLHLCENSDIEEKDRLREEVHNACKTISDFIDKMEEKNKSETMLDEANRFFKKGMSEVKFDLHTADIKNIYKQLLSPLIVDDDLLDIAIQDAEKFKERLYYKFEVESIGKGDDTGKTLEDFVENYRKEFIKGKYITSQQLWYIIKTKLKFINDFYSQDGTVSKISVVVSFA